MLLSQLEPIFRIKSIRFPYKELRKFSASKLELLNIVFQIVDFLVEAWCPCRSYSNGVQPSNVSNAKTRFGSSSSDGQRKSG